MITKTAEKCVYLRISCYVRYCWIAQQNYYYYYNRLMAFFQDNLGKPAPER